MKNYLNIQRHALSGYFERVALESRFYATHISLLMALFYYSDSDAPEKPFPGQQAKADAVLPYQIYRHLP